MNELDMDEAHQAEFGVIAGWTAELLVDREPAAVLAGACRGSGSPAVLAWLAESLCLTQGTRLLDIGAGLGGALSWAEQHYGIDPVAVEPMAQAAAGSTRLFGLTSVSASALALPLRDASADVAWFLGVLDTLDDPLAALREARRVLRVDGRVGVLAYLADGPIDPAKAPRGNRFQSAAELDHTLDNAGFVVIDRLIGQPLPEAPVEWQLRQARLQTELEERHRHDPRWIDAIEQERRFATLLDSGAVCFGLIHAICV